MLVFFSVFPLLSHQLNYPVIKSVEDLQTFTVLVEISAPVIKNLNVYYTVLAHYEPEIGKWVVEGTAGDFSFMLLSHVVLDALLEEALFNGFAVTFMDPEGSTLTLSKISDEA